MGGGDYSLDVSGFGAGDYLHIEMPSATNIEVVFSTAPLNEGGVAIGATVDTAGNGIFADRDGNLEIGNGGSGGMCAIIVEGKLYARIALHNSSFSVNDCFALPLPLFARKDDVETHLAIGIFGSSPKWAGFQFLLPQSSVVRLTGFNLPRTLTSYSGQTQSTINAEGGNYGIEFTIPEDSESVEILNGTFWLYIR